MFSSETFPVGPENNDNDNERDPMTTIEIEKLKKILVEIGWICPDPEVNMTKIDVGPYGIVGIHENIIYKKNKLGWEKHCHCDKRYLDASVGQNTVWAISVDNEACYKTLTGWQCFSGIKFAQVRTSSKSR